MKTTLTVVLLSSLSIIHSLSALTVTNQANGQVKNGITFNNISVSKSDTVVIAVASSKNNSVSIDFSSNSGAAFETISTASDNPVSVTYVAYAAMHQTGSFNFTVIPSSNAGGQTRASLFVLSPTFGYRVFPITDTKTVFSAAANPSGTFDLAYTINESGLSESVFIEAASSSTKTVNPASGNAINTSVSISKRKIGSVEATDPTSRVSAWTFNTNSSNAGSAMGVLFSEAYPALDLENDLILGQFDLKPDMDDVHSAAAFACMLEHPILYEANYFIYSGAYGVQNGDFITEAKSLGLYNTLFGSSNWDEVKDENGPVADYNDVVRGASTRVANTLNAGGKVWVIEGGQSDFTLDWVNELDSFHSLDPALVKYGVFVIQHSWFNEKQSGNTSNTSEVLDALRPLVTYVEVDDGNFLPGVTFNPNIFDRGIQTPCFNTNYIIPDSSATEGGIPDPDQEDYLGFAKGETGYPANINARAAEIWTKADEVADTWTETPSYSPIDDGGVDFSDCIMAWFIVNDIGDVTSAQAFWDKYVTNNPQLPFPDWETPASIPGTIEAENYDYGGSGVAYSDFDGGNNGTLDYRESDDVDSEGSTVGWTRGGEWLEYTVDTTAGNYTISARVASAVSQNGRKLRVKLDGVTLATLNVPNGGTGSWTNFTTISVSGVSIPATTGGVIRLEFVKGKFDLDSVTIN
ncbi:MAG: carbohydrate-binding domain-containing protein [Verrucomicrobiota bacterium]